ncbi:universal stress protein [uncultured Litoreibacter sp.]|uniref:universal stress protein n=1 Tax=uncultured Litoreibacter sp. TaxID=1392394 RepID=UPI0026335FA6|nr:universal stress protein [uncultured Litoreibacter sp.]
MTKRILVAIDLHQAADRANLLAEAVTYAQVTSSKLILLNVVDIDFDSSMVDRFKDVKNQYASAAKNKLADVAKRHVPDDLIEDIKVTTGRSYSKVIDAARELEVDMIMMAAHKEGMKDYLLGMTAARVVRHAPCTVLVVRTNQN